jgi:hypothetical protein
MAGAIKAQKHALYSDFRLRPWDNAISERSNLIGFYPHNCIKLIMDPLLFSNCSLEWHLYSYSKSSEEHESTLVLQVKLWTPVGKKNRLWSRSLIVQQLTVVCLLNRRAHVNDYMAQLQRYVSHIVDRSTNRFLPSAIYRFVKCCQSE